MLEVLGIWLLLGLLLRAISLAVHHRQASALNYLRILLLHLLVELVHPHTSGAIPSKPPSASLILVHPIINNI